ncbi:hypothetical protein AB1Y20_010607 [Prymnesium parvum]|uniref:Uncharacterized protein n=1 Tax=Prymnesium parvum TaxID=97485 RepID=A0AB34IRJ4_PRYPA
MPRTPSRDPRPRRQGGGRSRYYEARREERGTAGQHAAEWSDAAAQSVFTALHEGSARRGVAIGRFVEDVLVGVAAGDNRFTARECREMCAADRDVATGIMRWHALLLAEAASRAARIRRVRTFLKPLRERARARGSVGRLAVTTATAPLKGTFHQWLSTRPEEERLRELPEGGRTRAGLDSWPRAWQERWGADV